MKKKELSEAIAEGILNGFCEEEKMKIRTTEEILSELSVLDTKYDHAAGLEAEIRVDVKRCDLRIKRWVSVAELKKWVENCDDSTASNEFQIRKTTLLAQLK